jgi:hypothetical protein
MKTSGFAAMFIPIIGRPRLVQNLPACMVAFFFGIVLFRCRFDEVVRMQTRCWEKRAEDFSDVSRGLWLTLPFLMINRCTINMPDIAKGAWILMLHVVFACTNICEVYPNADNRSIGVERSLLIRYDGSIQ